MKKYLLPISCIIALGAAEQSEARPVSYPEGWTVMQHNDADANTLHVHYSPNRHYSIGYKAERWRDRDWQFHGAQLNYLAKRWNAPASQANLYFKNGVGVAYSDYQNFDNDTELAAFSGMAFDWEDRRYFTSYENRYTYAGDFDKFFMQKARIGIAPYVGDYGDIHTWLMLQVDHNPTADDKLIFTPLVRLFKDEYLAEAGVNDNGDVLIHWAVRF